MDTQPFDSAVSLHYIDAGHVIGDVHPFHYRGNWYLYYLMPGGGYESALLVSDDLLRWREVELEHEEPLPERQYFVLGVFQTPDGVFRSYHGSTDGIMKAQESADLLLWRNSEKDFDIPPQPAVFESRRDPFVFWNEGDGKYWCVMTCRSRDGRPGSNGVVGYATSPDLRNWANRGSLYSPGTIGEPECPQMFRIGDRWYLLASVYDEHRGVGKPSYWMSIEPGGPWQKMRPDSLDGEDLRAAQVCFDGFQWVLLGWIPSKEDQWGGYICLPRQVYSLDDGTLATRLERSVSKRIRGDQLLSIAEDDVISRISGGGSRTGRDLVTSALPYAATISPARFERFDMDLTVAVSLSRARVGITIATTEEHETRIIIEGDESARTLLLRTSVGELISAMQLRYDEPLEYRFRIIREADIVEVFLNDRYSLAGRLRDSRGPVSLGVVTDVPARFRDISVYNLATLVP